VWLLLAGAAAGAVAADGGTCVVAVTTGAEIAAVCTGAAILATAGGCLSAQYISAWLITRLKSAEAAREVLHYFAPVGEKEEYVTRALAHIQPQENASWDTIL